MSDTAIPMGDPTPTPDPTPAQSGPDWSAFEQAGITPDSISEIQNALNLTRGLNNLDTRGQYLQQIINPQYDGQFLQQVTQPQQQPDPWEQYNQQFAPEPQYIDPQGNPVDPNMMYQPQGFDPSILPQALDPALQTYGEQWKNEVLNQLQSMAQDQQIRETAASAAREAGLPPTVASLIENHVRETSKTTMNAQPGQIASEFARKLQTELAQWKATPPVTPPPAGSVPGGPAPDTLQRPTTFEEALEFSKNVLNQ